MASKPEESRPQATWPFGRYVMAFLPAGLAGLLMLWTLLTSPTPDNRTLVVWATFLGAAVLWMACWTLLYSPATREVIHVERRRVGVRHDSHR